MTTNVILKKLGDKHVAAHDALAKEEWAYSMGIQAYTFGLPFKIFERERALRIGISDEAAAELCKIAPVAPINQIGHMLGLATSDTVMPYTPNNDTVYSGALVELDKPIVLDCPDITDRYFSVEVADAVLSNQFYIGTRAGGGGKAHVIIPPFKTKEQLAAWNIPDDLEKHYMHTPSCMLAIRIWIDPNLTDDPTELANLRSVQESFSLTTLTYWPDNKGQVDIPARVQEANKENRPDLDNEDPLDGIQRLKDLSFWLKENPPPPAHRAAVEPFKYIGLNVGELWDETQVDAAMLPGINRAMKAGIEVMSWKVKFRGTPYPSRWNNLREGSYGFDYLDRAVGALEGLFVHDYEECTYYSTYEALNPDTGKGELLNTGKKYTLHWKRSDIPRVKDLGFWSITMYGTDFQLCPNKINRYSFGNNTTGYKENLEKDGSVTIYIQREDPRDEPGMEDVNWLPCDNDPTDKQFRLNFRIYLPRNVVMDDATREKFIPPVLERTSE